LRESGKFGDIPLLVAVNMYQMPLANRVKQMPRAHYIFTPLKKADVRDRLKMFAAGSAAPRNKRQ
jgi:hypothetical protein